MFYVHHLSLIIHHSSFIPYLLGFISQPMEMRMVLASEFVETVVVGIR